ncbi:MAG: hypothetical protein ACTSRG_08360 [Candidatus Helarchaeota archaeon]
MTDSKKDILVRLIDIEFELNATKKIVRNLEKKIDGLVELLKKFMVISESFQACKESLIESNID